MEPQMRRLLKCATLVSAILTVLALLACPKRHVSVPVMLLITLALWLAWARGRG